MMRKRYAWFLKELEYCCLNFDLLLEKLVGFRVWGLARACQQ